MWLLAALVLQFIIRLRFPAQKSIACVISDRYGAPTVSLLRKFESINYKERKCELDISFISNCINNDLVPKFVQFKVANRGLRSSKVYKRSQQDLLKEELITKKRSLKVLDNKKNTLVRQIQSTVRNIDSFISLISSWF